MEFAVPFQGPLPFSDGGFGFLVNMFSYLPIHREGQITEWSRENDKND